MSICIQCTQQELNDNNCNLEKSASINLHIPEGSGHWEVSEASVVYSLLKTVGKRSPESSQVPFFLDNITCYLPLEAWMSPLPLWGHMFPFRENGPSGRTCHTTGQNTLTRDMKRINL